MQADHGLVDTTLLMMNHTFLSAIGGEALVPQYTSEPGQVAEQIMVCGVKMRGDVDVNETDKRVLEAL
jgi:hypothetical protein